jgi:phage replication O-like protein O
MSKLLIPNTCQVPNVLLDSVMPQINGSALKVLLVIVRLTYGFNMPSRRISLSRLCDLTGLARQSVASAITDLGNLINVERGPKNSRTENEYSLNINLSTGELVQKVDQSKNWTSLKNITSLVQKVDSLKPSIKPNKRESTESDKLIPDSLSTKSKRKLTRSDPAVLAAFDRFYGAFPRHTARQKALDAWLKLNPNTALTTAIMEAVGRYAAEVEGTERQFILHPATWLNGKRWEDEPANGNGNGHVKPVQVKDLGNGMLEVDGRVMDQRTYERRHGQTAT